MTRMTAKEFEGFVLLFWRGYALVMKQKESLWVPVPCIDLAAFIRIEAFAKRQDSEIQVIYGSDLEDSPSYTDEEMRRFLLKSKGETFASLFEEVLLRNN